MHIAILGAAGMVGKKLTDALMKTGKLQEKKITALTLADIVAAARPEGAEVEIRTLAGDFSDEAEIRALVALKPDVIFHLAAIVSGEAEQDFEKGYRINLDGMRFLLEEIRKVHLETGYRPRVVFTSSIAVFGAPFPPSIPDDYFQTPLTSYGTQKAICELLLADYSRKGFVDGVGIRLPTICVRPGKPNKAASGFFSSIIREPLAGQRAILPLPDIVRHWHASPRAAVGFLLHAATLSIAALENRPNLTMPGISCTVAEQIEALEKVAGKKATDLIDRVPDPAIGKIVSGWAERFDPHRALALGFAPDASFEEIIRIHIEDELGGKIP